MAKLTHTGTRFEAISTFAEKEIFKGAGFRWDPEARVWYTTWIQAAMKVANLADTKAAAILNETLKEKQANIEASKASSADVLLPRPDGLEYLPFQKAGISYAANKNSVLIADEMGLGKTIQACGLINVWNPTKILVIVPATLKINWMREISKWSIQKRQITVVGSKTDLTDLPKADEAGIVVINYDIVKKWEDYLKSRVWDLMILDECHAIKNNKAIRTKVILGDFRAQIPAIQATRKVYLTGTPILNRPVELWTLLNGLLPAQWGSFKSFTSKFCNGFQDRYGWNCKGASNLEELQELLRSKVMVRRLKKDVLKELPPKVRQIIEIPMNGFASAVKDEQALWDRHQENLDSLRAALELSKASDNPEDFKDAVENLKKAQMVAFTEMSAARRKLAVAKLPLAIEHITNTLENKDKVIVFAHHKEVIQGLKEAFGDIAVVLDGSTSQENRQIAVDRFQKDPEIKIFIGSIKAAGVGITLTAADTVIFCEMDWTPALLQQAEDRAHRIGQLNSVLVQSLVIEGSLDARVAELVVEKLNIIDKALDKDLDPVEMIIPMVPTASKVNTVSKKTVETRAVKITPAQILQVQEALFCVLGSCDGAAKRDNAGFNRFDAMIARSLAHQPVWSPKQAVLAQGMLMKYKRQIPSDLYNGLLEIQKTN